MFNVCPNCSAYRADKTIDPQGPFAVCPECGGRHPFRQLPLLLVGGPSGAGKTATLLALTGRFQDAVLLEQDILWQDAFNDPENHYRDFFETWLRMAKNIGQSGRPIVLFGAGACVPENIEPCIERRYFASTHYLALVCAEEILVRRLKQRPGWRKSGHEAFIEAQINFNRWLLEHAETSHPRISLLDTTKITVQETTMKLETWIRAQLATKRGDSL